MNCPSCNNETARKHGFKVKSGGERYQQFQCLRCYRIYLGCLVDEHKPHQTVEQRFWAKVEKTEGCWNWKASKSKGGYGLFKVDGKMVLTHRFAYELARGIIPDGLTLDHLCKNQSCVKPEHLEVVTLQENILRSCRNLSNQCLLREDL